MKYFKCQRQDVGVQSVLSEVLANQPAWSEQTGRQRRVSVQAETNAIPLRGLRRSKIMGRRRRDVHETRYTSLAARFPQTVALLEALAAELDGRLGRAKFARLPPGARVLPHVDRGEYYARRDRYHLVVDSTGESVLRAGDEEVSMSTGELWWFDNKELHSARNESDHHRTHLVFDVEPNEAHDIDDTQGIAAPDPRQLLAAVHASSPDNADVAVADAVELYLAVRRNPLCWEGVLTEHGCVERAQREPIGVLAELLWPSLEQGRRKRRESAIGWSLAQLDLGRCAADQIPGALRDAGGIRAIHHGWHTSKDQMLYGAD